MLEERGTPTVVLGLIRPHLEATRPPRALFLPFQLGRPLGEPEDAGFQHRVLAQALALLERADGPVILEDWDEQAPNWADTPGWQPPAVPAFAPPASPEGWRSALAAELAALRPAWEAARARRGRSIVGLSGMAPEAWPGFAAAVLAGELPTVPAHPTTALGMRFLADDLKAFYAEAAQASGAPPAARQWEAWFWRGTVAGALLVAVRQVAMASDNNALKTVGGRFFVPAWWVPAD